MDGKMKQLLPRVYWAGKRHEKPGVLVWIGPKRPQSVLGLPWWHWRKLVTRHVRVLPVHKKLLFR